MVVLGTVEDMFYTEKGYKPENENEMYMSVLEETDWLAVSPRTRLENKLYGTVKVCCLALV